MESAEVFTWLAAAEKMGEEATTEADLEVEQSPANKGEADLEIAPAPAELEEGPMHTDIFLDISRRLFQSKFSTLFSCSPSNDTTRFSPMHFAHTAPPGADAATTLQVFSVKVLDVEKPLRWPLHVYGVVAARDAVDHRRNILFLRERDHCQLLTRQDSCLRLTGPSRAIVAADPVDFEIELIVKEHGSTKSEDFLLMRRTLVYSGCNNETAVSLDGDCCKITLRCARLEKTVQATVVAVRVVNRRNRAWPFKHGGKVTCVASRPAGSSPEEEEEVLLQDRFTEPTTSSGDYIRLSRHVVSVELNGELRVSIRCSKFSAHLLFPAQESKSCVRTRRHGPYEVQVTVAWSMPPIRDERSISSSDQCVDDNGRTADAKEIIHRRRRKITKMETTQTATEIYSLLDLISSNAMKLKPLPTKLRISDFTASEVQIHMDNMYVEVTSLLQMMENVHRDTTKLYKAGTAAPRTYYNYGLKVIFKWLDQLCTQLEEMGYLSRIKLEPPSETVEVSPLEVGGDEDEDSDRKPQTEEEYFEGYRRGWVSNWSISCGSFTETTSLSPMHFTPSTPGRDTLDAIVDSTLQIYSIKIASIQEDSGLSWPLRVYGVVAARDEVDRNRNIIFFRERNNCQVLTQEDPFLRLTGPSRAIVTVEPADVEIELRVKGGTESEDRPLMSHPWYFNSNSYLGLRSLHSPIERTRCTVVLSAEEIQASVQATIVGIHVHVPEGRPSPFEYGGRVVCSSLPRRKGKLPMLPDPQDPLFRQVVLHDGEITTCSRGYVNNLSRHVVSVKSRGKLEVVVQARSRSGAMAGQVAVCFKAQKCDITEGKCQLGDSELKISIAWSRLLSEKSYL